MKALFFLILMAIFLFMGSFSFSQAKKISGTLLLSDGKRFLTNSPVMITDISGKTIGNGVTGTDGKFDIAINDTIKWVFVKLVNSKMDIIYPLQGKVLVSEEVRDFIVGTSATDILTQNIAKSYNEIKNSLSGVGLKQDEVEQTLAAYRDEIQKMTNIKMDSLKNQIDLANKREEFYPEFASSVNNYINEAKDLKDAFKFSANHAFDDNQALQVLNDAVISYSAAYEDINKKYIGYEKIVDDLWQSESKSSSVREFFDYALGEIHSSNIFTLNLKIRDINDYNTGNFKGSKKAFKETISREIESAVLQLERRLEELDKRSQIVLSKLAS